MCADRNLLFGILALQLNFVSRDQLVEGMHKWVLDKTKGLGEIFVAATAMDVEQSKLLDALVDKHVEKNGGSIEQSLQQLRSVDQYATQQLRAIDDTDVQATIGGISNETVDPHATIPLQHAPKRSSNRFRILRPHARGGLGEVFFAHDTELSREVALKEIQDSYADDRDCRQRFMREAQITGNLEHPGIVPVYALGTYDDGRPFYAMRFIRGESLKEAIDAFHEKYDSGLLNGEAGLELRKLLRRLVDVCNAVAYAHSRGVLHRDLKPGNIVLGKYGETLVVDWGLAKAKGQTEFCEASLGPVTPGPSRSGTQTVPGSAIGTPAYMSPEQASGKLDELTAGTDVYSLGATLFHLLTGHLPIVGETANQILSKAQLGEIRKPRELRSDVPKPLEAICLKAMAQTPTERYQSAVHLADDIENWLADEPVAACREGLLETVRRFVRKHYWTVSTVAGCLLGLTILLTVIAALQSRVQALRSEAKFADLQTINAQRDASRARFFHSLAKIRERAMRRPLGWSWENESELESLNAEELSSETKRAVREEYAKLKTASDLRKQSSFSTGYKVGCIAWSPTANNLVIGERTATSGMLHVQILNADNYSPIKTVACLMSISNLFTNSETDGITSLYFSHDGGYLYAGTRAGEVVCVDAHSWNIVQRWKAHSHRILGIVGSEDSRTIATASGQEVKWWNCESLTFNCKRTESTIEPISQILSLNNSIYVQASAIFRFSFSSLIKEQTHAPGDVTCLTGESFWFRRDDVGLVQVNSSGESIRRLKAVRSDPSDCSLIGSKDGRWAIVKTTNTIEVWDFISGTQLAVLDGVEFFTASVDSARQRLLVADDEHVDCYELRADPICSYIPSSISRLKSSAMSEEKLHLVGRQSTFAVTEVEAWELKPLKRLRQVGINYADPRATASSSGSSAIVYFDEQSGQVCEFNATTQSSRPILKDAIANCDHLCLLNQNDWIVFDSYPRPEERLMVESLLPWSITVLDRKSGQRVYTWTNRLSALVRGQSHFSDLVARDKHFAAAFGETVIFKNIEASDDVSTWKEPGASVSRLCFHADDRVLVGLASGGLRMIEKANSRTIHKAQLGDARITALASSQSSVVAGDERGDVYLLSEKNGTLELECRFKELGNAIEMLSLSTDGAILVHVREEPTVKSINLNGLRDVWRSHGLSE